MYLGIDIGSLAAKAVLVDGRGEIAGRALLPSGHEHGRTAEEITDRALAEGGIMRRDLAGVIGTGYGRTSVPFADGTVTEISCHGRGAASMVKGCRTVIDIGGQDSKIILVDETGKAVDFSMNDRCAAGTGRFLEIMSGSLGIPLEEAGRMALSAEGAAKISSVCTVFAESEVVGLIANGEERPRIVKGLCRSIAEKIAGLARRFTVEPPVAMTGGVALNEGVVSALEEKLGLHITVPANPQFIGALGAALTAMDRDEKQ